MPPCPHCSASQSIVEVEGQRLHTYSDRWIPCTGGDAPPGRVAGLAKVALWIQLTVPVHHLHHFFQIIRSRF